MWCMQIGGGIIRALQQEEDHEKNGQLDLLATVGVALLQICCLLQWSCSVLCAQNAYLEQMSNWCCYRTLFMIFVSDWHFNSKEI